MCTVEQYALTSCAFTLNLSSLSSESNFCVLDVVLKAG